MSSDKHPLISVLIPSYNHEMYVEEAVRSIWAQDYPNIEIIAIDDASSDKTPAILDAIGMKSPVPMRVYRNIENKGAAATLNRALQMSKGEFVALFASDDKFAPNRFEKQVQLFVEDPALMIVYGNGWAFSGDNKISRLHGKKIKHLLSRSAKEILKTLYLNRSPLFLQTSLIKKDFLMGIGGYDESILADDWVLNIRMFQRLVCHGHFAYLDEDLVYYRLHDKNIHKDDTRQTNLKLEVIERYTPPELKKEAYSNIYWSMGWRALKENNWASSFQHLLASQKNEFNMIRIINLLWYLVKIPFKKLYNQLSMK